MEGGEWMGWKVWRGGGDISILDICEFRLGGDISIVDTYEFKLGLPVSILMQEMWCDISSFGVLYPPSILSSPSRATEQILSSVSSIVWSVLHGPIASSHWEHLISSKEEALM